jgi:hypothetical protein
MKNTDQIPDSWFNPVLPPGQGIVTGLTIRRDANQNIVLYPGYGWTSNGQRIVVEQGMIFYFYEKIDPAQDPDLLATFNSAPVWELFTDGYELQSLHPRRPQEQREQPFLDDKVMVIYSEGEKNRFLLVNRQVMAETTFSRRVDFQFLKATEKAEQGFDIWGKKQPIAAQSDPSIGVSNYTVANALHPVLELPVLAMRRVGYGHLDLSEMPCDEVYEVIFCNPGLKSFEDLHLAYQQVIAPAYEQLSEAICQLHEVAADWLSEHSVEYLNKHLGNLGLRWKAYQELPILAGKAGDIDLPDQSAIQYWYALLRDLTEAYNETREAALAYHALIPDSDYEFPNHLYLGTPQEEQTFQYLDPFRTNFRATVTLNEQMPQLERLHFLHWRMAMMMKSFFVPELEWDDTASDSYLSVFRAINSDNPDGITGKINLPIRITPSRDFDQPLGRRAIPYYFDVADHPQSLHWYWDYEATRHNRADHHLSYHAENDSADVKAKRGEVFAGIDKTSYTRQPSMIHRHLFDQRQYPFLRMEGLVGKMGLFEGKNFQIPDLKWQPDDQEPITLNEYLNRLKKQYNLCFETVFIEIGKEPTVFCGHCVDHYGGTYRGGILAILVAAVPSGPNRPAAQFKIVGDFYTDHGCTCDVDNDDSDRDRGATGSGREKKKPIGK